MDDDFLPISSLQHYAYCPRQFALIHIEQVWEENFFTADGRRLHARVDAGAPEQRRNVRYERSVLLQSSQYRMTGKMDLLEIHEGKATTYFPVEYKRGKPKVADWDRIQLCAQALCIEEMRSVEVNDGALWYWEVRCREAVHIDETLRSTTVATLESAHKLKESGITPSPIADNRRCRACSLVELCRPDRFRNDRSARYVEELFQSEEAP